AVGIAGGGVRHGVADEVAGGGSQSADVGGGVAGEPDVAAGSGDEAMRAGARWIESEFLNRTRGLIEAAQNVGGHSGVPGGSVGADGGVVGTGSGSGSIPFLEANDHFGVDCQSGE